MKTNKEYFHAKRQELEELVRDIQIQKYYRNQDEREMICYSQSKIEFDLMQQLFFYHEWNWVMLKDYKFHNPNLEHWPPITHFSIQIYP